MGAPLFKLCSFSMASLFALSASFQFNDPEFYVITVIDWYLWFPLYATASVVNLVNGFSVFSHKTIHQIARFALGLGLFLLIKVVIEDRVLGIAGFWSLDMKERVVRERFGSGFVIICMFLQLKAINKENKVKPTTHIQYGMAVLVAVSYVFSLVFFSFQKRDMKF